MAPKLGARKSQTFKAVSTAPSFNKTPMGPSTPPVPYAVFQDLGSSLGTVNTVNFNSNPAYVNNQSSQPTCIGDAPGVALGVRSGTVSGPVKPVKGSSSVNVGGQPIIREGDPCTLNGGNCPGVYISSSVPSCDVVGGIVVPNAPPIVPETSPEEKSWGKRYSKGITDGATKSWDGVKGSAETVWDASGLSPASPDVAGSARERMWEGTKAVAGLVSDAALVASPMGATPAADDARQRLADLGKGVAKQVVDKYRASYAEGGLAQALGTGTWDVLNVIIQALIAKGAGMVTGATGRGLGFGTKVAEEAVVVEKTTVALERAERAAKTATKIQTAAVDGVRIAEGAAPKPSFKISATRRAHILDGDRTGGGHGPGRGIPNKSEFPSSLSDDDVITGIERIANDSASYTSGSVPIGEGRFPAIGAIKGVPTKVIVEPAGEGVITAWPIDVPRNP